MAGMTREGSAIVYRAFVAADFLWVPTFPAMGGSVHSLNCN